MARKVGVGIQNFEDAVEKDTFYVDKTDFIRQWWENRDKVTLITRPRRFGKTLTMSMLEYFFSTRYADKGELFEGLSIYTNDTEGNYRELQGTYPVISISFGTVKSRVYRMAFEEICLVMAAEYRKAKYLLTSEGLDESEKRLFQNTLEILQGFGSESVVINSINILSELLYKHHGKKTFIFLDEYDTPLQEAYVSGYWDEMVAFIRTMFNATFKTNEYLGKAIMTGITRVSKESIFSDLNNLKVVTVASELYANCFGFTEEEVFAACDEMEIKEKKKVRRWYDGFNFGSVRGIYNPWSIINFLSEKKFRNYWANTSSNALVSRLLMQGNGKIKSQFECLLRGEPIEATITEEVVFNELDKQGEAVWSLLLASGYLKIVGETDSEKTKIVDIVNFETRDMFEALVSRWFDEKGGDYSQFLKYLLAGDLEGMNEYLSSLARTVFSYFDVGNGKNWQKYESFYHGFAIGLLVELTKEYEVKSNREAGLGRYDLCLIKRDNSMGIIMEFKAVFEERGETLESASASALKQIQEKDYEAELIGRGIKEEAIRKYGFAFAGKNVLIVEYVFEQEDTIKEKEAALAQALAEIERLKKQQQ